MALIELDPPSTLPRGQYRRRPFSAALRRGVVLPVEARRAEPADACRHAHEQRIVGAAGLEQQHAAFGIADSRLASTDPAEPDPTMT